MIWKRFLLFLATYCEKIRWDRAHFQSAASLLDQAAFQPIHTSVVATAANKRTTKWQLGWEVSRRRRSMPLIAENQPTLFQPWLFSLFLLLFFNLSRNFFSRFDFRFSHNQSTINYFHWRRHHTDPPRTKFERNLTAKHDERSAFIAFPCALTFYVITTKPNSQTHGHFTPLAHGLLSFQFVRFLRSFYRVWVFVFWRLEEMRERISTFPSQGSSAGRGEWNSCKFVRFYFDDEYWTNCLDFRSFSFAFDTQIKPRTALNSATDNDNVRKVDLTYFRLAKFYQ